MNKKRKHKIPKAELSRILIIGKAVARDNDDPIEFLKTKNWDTRRQKSFWIGYNLKKKIMEMEDEDSAS